MAKDYYQILGINKSASPEDIKKAFRKLAHEHHPDKKGGNEGKFKEINEAYQVLGNPDKRQQYDQFGANFESAGGPDSTGRILLVLRAPAVLTKAVLELILMT